MSARPTRFSTFTLSHRPTVSSFQRDDSLMAPSSSAWAPASWRGFPAAQQPEWPDVDEMEGVLGELRSLPPLVFAGEARTLKEGLARVEVGEAFLLQAGDCAEAFGDFSAN